MTELRDCKCCVISLRCLVLWDLVEPLDCHAAYTPHYHPTRLYQVDRSEIDGPTFGDGTK